MNSEKKVSVVIPSYNRESTIKRSIMSVLNQTYSNIEVLVVDDCSSDNTTGVVKEIDDTRLKYFRLEKNSGACTARNVGIDKASGDYIAFQDSDDVWYEDKLSKQMDAMDDTGADVCFSAYNRVGAPGKKFKLQSSIKSHEDMCASYGISTQTVVARREVFDNCRFDTQLKRLQDYEWGIRASEKYKFFYLGEELVDQYVQDNSLSNNGELTLKDTVEYIINKHSAEFENNYRFKAFLYYELYGIKKRLGQDNSTEKKIVLDSLKWKKDYFLYLLRFIKNH